MAVLFGVGVDHGLLCGVAPWERGVFQRESEPMCCALRQSIHRDAQTIEKAFNAPFRACWCFGLRDFNPFKLI